MSETYVHCARCGVAWDFCECWDGPTLDPEAETPTEPVAVVAWWRGMPLPTLDEMKAELAQKYPWIVPETTPGTLVKPDVCPACHGSGCTGNIPMCYKCGRMAGEQ